MAPAVWDIHVKVLVFPFTFQCPNAKPYISYSTATGANSSGLASLQASCGRGEGLHSPSPHLH